MKLGKWTEMEPQAGKLAQILSDQGGNLVPVAEIAEMAGKLEWQHRDPLDRLLAAQALRERRPTPPLTNCEVARIGRAASGDKACAASRHSGCSSPKRQPRLAALTPSTTAINPTIAMSAAGAAIQMPGSPKICGRMKSSGMENR